MSIGASVRRREDWRFLTGNGRYVDDMDVSGCLYASIVRSVHAAARLRRVDVAAAAALPGVTCVLTGADWRDDGLGNLPCISPVSFADGRSMNTALHPVLANGHVRYAGEPIALVVAETASAALDGAEAVDVDYQEHAAVIDVGAAAEAAMPWVHEGLGGNLAFETSHGDSDSVGLAFEKADAIVELSLCNNRQVVNPLEPRATLGLFDPSRDHYTLYTTNQAPHLLRALLCTHTLRCEEHRLRVVAPDVGGGFGMKLAVYPEDALVLWAARRTGRPVRWTATRSESFLSDTHARGHVTRARMALDAEGQVLGLEVDTIGELGAYASLFGAGAVGMAYGRMMSGPYRIPALCVRIRGVYTNTVPVDVYRGAGRPEAAYVVERLLDAAAAQSGVDPLELRRRNVIGHDDYPYATPTGMVYDSGNFPLILEQLRALSGYEALREEQHRARAQGRLFGIGVSTFTDYGGGPKSRVSASIGRQIGSFEVGAVQVHPTGSVTVSVGTHNHGQGHETSFLQVVSGILSCSADRIQFVMGDTDRVVAGLGTWGSRSMVLAGNSLAVAAERVHIKMCGIAAALLDCGAEEVIRDENLFVRRGTNQSFSFDEIAHQAYHGPSYPETLSRGLLETVFYEPDNWVFSGGAHLAVVEVDEESGTIAIRAYYCIDDVGRIVNPMIVEGQVHGGVAQGIGQAIMEHCRFDERSGQLLSGSFMDYCMPRADDLPDYTTGTIETPAPGNALGLKGAGESGTIGAPPAIVNAVTDALRPLGVRPIDMPLTPQAVWQAMRAGGRQQVR